MLVCLLFAVAVLHESKSGTIVLISGVICNVILAISIFLCYRYRGCIRGCILRCTQDSQGSLAVF